MEDNRSIPQSKFCAVCGIEIFKKDNESYHEWGFRETCCFSHTAILERMKNPPRKVEKFRVPKGMRLT